MREFFEKFAESKGLDPFDPETWYNMSWDNVKDVKVSCIVLLKTL